MKNKGKRERWKQENAADHNVGLTSVKGAWQKEEGVEKASDCSVARESFGQAMRESDDCHRGVDIREECLGKHHHLRLSLPSSCLGKAQSQLKHCSGFQVFCS